MQNNNTTEIEQSSLPSNELGIPLMSKVTLEVPIRSSISKKYDIFKMSNFKKNQIIF